MSQETWSVGDLALLQRAADWGLMRSLDGRRLLMRGSFSLPVRDMRWLIEKAGGEPVEGADQLRPRRADVVLLGASPGSLHDVGARELQEGCTWATWTEAELVLALTPRLEDLAPSPAPQQVSPPF